MVHDLAHDERSRGCGLASSLLRRHFCVVLDLEGVGGVRKTMVEKRRRRHVTRSEPGVVLAGGVVLG